MANQPMTSAKRFVERYPEVADAVTAAIAAAGEDPAAYEFSVARLDGDQLSGAYYPAGFVKPRLEDYEAGAVPPYTWFPFTATVDGRGITSIEVHAGGDGGPA